jgi:Tfp pilus assembly protein PilX
MNLIDPKLPKAVACAPFPGRAARPTHRRRGEHGSAFTVALLVLLVLTISGLALTLITQTEVRIGVNERTTNRTLYATDSGIQVATARNIWRGSNSPSLLFYLNTTQQDSGTSPATTFSDQVTVTPLVAVSWQPSVYGQINQNTQNYLNTTYIVNSTSSRVGVNNTFSQTLSKKTVSSMISIQPADPAGAQVNNLTLYNSTDPLQF